MSKIRLHPINQALRGTIELSGSKSISNRMLIIQALCANTCTLNNLANADDTVRLQALLQAPGETTYDVHHAGTAARFLCAYLSLQNGTQILTGSSRMRQRPMKALVDALKTLGANIEYMEHEGFLPLRINTAEWKTNAVDIDGSISSQFISALLLIAPYLPNGLDLNIQGSLVSASYVDMTLALMQQQGIQYQRTDNKIHIEAQHYNIQHTWIESDWSAASYYYMFASLVPGTDLVLKGLVEQSTQGDRAIATLMESFGVSTTFLDKAIRLKHQSTSKGTMEMDCINCPDIAQTLFTICSAKGIIGLFSGLQTLQHKETDRISAMQEELSKVQTYLSQLPAKFSKKSDGQTLYMIQGEANTASEIPPSFETYQDHRMAMSLSGLAANMMIEIQDPEVVVKSYPNYWKDLTSIGVQIEAV